MSKKDKPTDGKSMNCQQDAAIIERSKPAEKVTVSGTDKKDWIGNQLKRIYDQAANEPLPDDMLELLGQLDEEDSKTSSETEQD